MLKPIIKIISLAVLAIGLTGCQKATIIDLYHSDTEKLEITEGVFSDPTFEPYRVGGVLFTPYTVKTPAGSGDSSYYKYSLYLGAYKLNHNIDSVTVNHIKVTGTEDLDFTELNQELSLPLEFSTDLIQKGEVELLEEINNQNMNLTKESKVMVVVNVSVIANGETITQDVTYDFETRFRTYRVER